jgi:hypothetical protein
MYIPAVIFGSAGATTRYDPHSMDTGFIDDYVIVAPFEFRETISKDCTTVAQRMGGVVRIRAGREIKSDIIRARQTPVA